METFEAEPRADVVQDHERQELLIALTNGLLAGREDAEGLASRIIGKHFRVSRCSYGEADDSGSTITVRHEYTDGSVVSAIGRHWLESYGESVAKELRSGRTLAIADVNQDPKTRGLSETYAAVGTRSLIAVPLIRDGRLRAIFHLSHKELRNWAPADVKLFEDAAARTWFALEYTRAERERRASDARLRLFIERAPVAIAMFDAKMRYLAASVRFLESYRINLPDPQHLHGRSHYDIFPEMPQRWRDVHKLVLAGETLTGYDDPFPRSDGSIDWVEWEMTPWLGADGAVGGALLFSRIVTERVKARRAMVQQADRLKAAEDRFLFVTNSAGAGDWDWDIEQNRLDWSPICKRLFGLPPEASISYERFLEVVHPDDRERTDAAVRACLQSGGASDYDIEYRAVLPDGTNRWIQAKGGAAFQNGRPIRMAGVVLDITQRKLHEEQTQFLMQEVNHRAKNLLMVVQAIASQSAARNPADFNQRFSERLKALAANQDLLVKNEWRGVEVDALVRAQLAPFCDLSGSRVRLEGPPLWLTAAASQSIGLALHELGTNAAKYGALSNSEGNVRICWNLNGDMFSIEWTERGGPPVVSPERPGFGTTVMTRMVEASLEGTAGIDYTPEGLAWRLRCDASAALEPGWESGQA